MSNKIFIFITLLFLGQTVPLSFIILDLSELGLDWTVTNALEIYNSQLIYLFSSLATPIFLIILTFQILKIREQKYFFYNVLNGIQELIVVFDQELREKFKNQAFIEFRHPEISLQVINKYKENQNFEWSVGDFQFLGSISKFQEGKILILKDITEIKKIEQTVKDQEKQITRSSQLASLGEMASGIAHEINNPLGVIVANVEILRVLLNDPSESIKKSLNTIDRMVSRMTGIIKAMKKLSRIDNIDVREKIHLSELFSDVLSISQINIKKLEIELEYDESVFNDKFVFGSSVQLSQVFINLITNACHATEHLEERWIKLQLQESDSFYEILVTNSGPQIPEEIQQKIFQPFFTTKDPGKGTGLGLSLSKNIIEMHKGHLTLDLNSANPRFSIQLPKS